MHDAEADRTRQHLPEPTMPWQAPGAHIVDVGGSPGDRVGGAVSVRTLVDLKRGNERKESCDVFLDRRRGHGLRPGIKLVRPHEVVRAAGVMRLLCVLSAFSVFRALNTTISSRVLLSSSLLFFPGLPFIGRRAPRFSLRMRSPATLLACVLAYATAYTAQDVRRRAVTSPHVSLSHTEWEVNL